MEQRTKTHVQEQQAHEQAQQEIVVQQQQSPTKQKPNEDFRTLVVKFSDAFIGMFVRHFEASGLPLSNYQKQCLSNSLTAIYTLLDQQQVSIQDPSLDRSSITTALMKVVALRLNPAAVPSEVFFKVRTTAVGKGRDRVFIKKVEAEVEGDGNETLVARYGRDVKHVHHYWAVYESDHFEYPKYRGIDTAPPIWEPKGQGGRVLRVVYPITKTSGYTEYHIAERADVINNLAAHIRNNMLRETFGIVENAYNANDMQKKQIDAEKERILNAVRDIGLDAALYDTQSDFARFISPAWRDPSTREAMIIRKMRNNILRKIPKDFSDDPTAQATYREMNTFREDYEPSVTNGNYFDRTQPPHDTSVDMYEKALDERPFADERAGELHA